ncbi:hypothetical protein MKQ70_32395 [Chitinophaga sedimenti]|uniref:hypothetical protein n=1 Tax=Chitinophaga sedimenti TaxID=2033606 RepID=UPI002002ACD7|nr:hypothetical protein [Chitinophaga sedimenti]MCK7559418.1 hypothetical protein [Chitinophaga sedimenti]
MKKLPAAYLNIFNSSLCHISFHHNNASDSAGPTFRKTLARANSPATKNQFNHPEFSYMFRNCKPLNCTGSIYNVIEKRRPPAASFITMTLIRFFMDRYLLMIHFNAVDNAQPATQPIITKNSASLHLALKDLYEIPVDQFHPNTAQYQGYKDFVSEAAIIDLTDGRKALSTYILPRGEEGAENSHVFLVVEPYTDFSALKLSNFITPYRDSPDMPVMLEWVLQNQDGYMQLGDTYLQVLQAVMDNTVENQKVLSPLVVSLDLTGLHHDDRPVKDLSHSDHIFTVEHFFENHLPAYRNLVHLPAAVFDSINVPGKEGHHFINATISNRLIPDIPIAQSLLIEPGEQNKAFPSLEPGRYIKIHEAMTDMSERMHFPVITSGDDATSKFIKLNNWEPSNGNLLSEIASLDLSKLMLRMATDSYFINAYHLKVELAPTSQHIKAAKGSSVTRHYQSKDFTQILYEMCFDSLKSIPATDAETPTHSFQLKDARIFDSAERVIMTLVPGTKLPDGIKTSFYIGFDTDLQSEHPIFSKVPPKQLLDDCDHHCVHQGKFYAQISRIENGSQHFTYGYEKFVYSLLAAHITNRLSVPNIDQVRITPSIVPDHKLLAQLHWLTPGATQPSSHTHGLINEQHLLFRLDWLKATQITGHIGAEQPPLRLVGIDVLDATTKDVLAKISRGTRRKTCNPAVLLKTGPAQPYK